MILRKIKEKINEQLYTPTQAEYKAVLDFFLHYQSFRTLYDCSRETKLDIEKCRIIKKKLYKDRQLGMYYFRPKSDPHIFMFEYIARLVPNFSSKMNIAEIGPGRLPIISDKHFVNWVGIDYNFKDGQIDFNGRIWDISKYPTNNVYKGTWETCSKIDELRDRLGSFDFVIGSHSFEHVFKPIEALNSASELLKPNGYLVLFVPDGFSDEPAARNEMTHTLYLVPDMIEELFHYCGKYKNLKIETFRPNYDYVITAQKI
ncbi:class I SAM-dependent methyltransferase [bacterium]|nr:class I SAM-dependent methyltransferase [bacterium]